MAFNLDDISNSSLIEFSRINEDADLKADFTEPLIDSVEKTANYRLVIVSARGDIYTIYLWGNIPHNPDTPVPALWYINGVYSGANRANFEVNGRLALICSDITVSRNCYSCRPQIFNLKHILTDIPNLHIGYLRNLDLREQDHICINIGYCNQANDQIIRFPEVSTPITKWILIEPRDTKDDIAEEMRIRGIKGEVFHTKLLPLYPEDFTFTPTNTTYTDEKQYKFHYMNYSQEGAMQDKEAFLQIIGRANVTVYSSMIFYGCMELTLPPWLKESCDILFYTVKQGKIQFETFNCQSN